MLNEPLFQNDIFEHIIKYMSFYLGYEHWFFIFCGVLLLLYLCYKSLMYRNGVSYEGSFPTDEYKFSFAEKSQVWAFAFLILCLAYNIFGIFSQEMSFFSNYDTRGNVIPLLETGVIPTWGVWGRFCPLAFWDTNILYAVTHNFWIISIYLSIQSLMIAWLLNCFLVFVPTWKRFVCIGLIMISPVMFSIGSVVFSERLLLIYIIGSFICMQKYSKQSDKKYFLWFAILLINFALYSKELCVLLYFGVLLYGVINLVWQGKIAPMSFLHPIQMARRYPFECLLFLSLLIFTMIYKAVMYFVFDSLYVSYRQMDLVDLLKIYYSEIISTIIALFLFFKVLFYEKKYFFVEGVVLGAIIITGVLCFVLKIGHPVPSMIYKSYYLIVPCIVSLIYILWRLKNKWIIALLSCVFFVNSLVRNYAIYDHEDGFSHRELAEYLVSKEKNSEVNIFVSNHLEYNLWFVKTFILPYQYYWPDAKINFFSSGYELSTAKFDEKEVISYKGTLSSGDYFVVRKNEYYSQDLEQISQLSVDKVFENKMFEVYVIK